MVDASIELMSANQISQQWILMSAGSIWEWYLDERVTRQAIRAPRFFLPATPSCLMRAIDLIPEGELEVALAGIPHYQFVDPPEGYTSFRFARLMQNFPLLETIQV